MIAESDDVLDAGGYLYFPPEAVRQEFLEKASVTDADRKCPHGVQFYDLVIDGRRDVRAAWSYETPRAALEKVAGRFGFWEDVKLG